jgi:hypothetical protein
MGRLREEHIYGYWERMTEYLFGYIRFEASVKTAKWKCGKTVVYMSMES